MTKRAKPRMYPNGNGWLCVGKFGIGSGSSPTVAYWEWYASETAWEFIIAEWGKPYSVKRTERSRLRARGASGLSPGEWAVVIITAIVVASGLWLL